VNLRNFVRYVFQVSTQFSDDFKETLWFVSGVTEPLFFQILPYGQRDSLRRAANDYRALRTAAAAERQCGGASCTAAPLAAPTAAAATGGEAAQAAAQSALHQQCQLFRQTQRKAATQLDNAFC
jgi:hypothetical protein